VGVGVGAIGVTECVGGTGSADGTGSAADDRQAEALAAALASDNRMEALELHQLRQRVLELNNTIEGLQLQVAKADAAGARAAGPHTNALVAVEEGRRREDAANIKDAAVISAATARWGKEVTAWIDGLVFWLRATVMPPLRRQHTSEDDKAKAALDITVL